MAEPMSLESQHLDTLVKKQVKVFLVSGVCLHGMLLRHDDDAIILDDSSKETLVYKDHITTVHEDRYDARKKPAVR